MIQLVHNFAAVRGAAFFVIFVCIFCAYRDVSDFLWGNILYTEKVSVEDAPSGEEDKNPHMLLVLS